LPCQEIKGTTIATSPAVAQRARTGLVDAATIESPRITLARALALGVRVSGSEAAAIVHEAVARTIGDEHSAATAVTAESCVLTRGGDVTLVGTAATAPPMSVVRLLDDLLEACDTPGQLAGTATDGTALDILEELSQRVSDKRRRVEVAAVALRGLVAQADAARALADAVEPAAPAAPPPSIPAPATPATTTSAVRQPSRRFDLVPRLQPAKLAGTMLAAAAGVVLVLQMPVPPRAVHEPSATAAGVPEVAAAAAPDITAAPGGTNADLLPKADDSPRVNLARARNTPPGPTVEDGTAPFRVAQVSFVRLDPLAAAGPVPLVDAGSTLDVESRSAATVTRPARREAEESAIEAVLGRYKSAFSALDAKAASAVWPTVNEQTLTKAFEHLESHAVSFDDCRIEVFASLAEAACTGSARYVRKAGNRTPKAEARAWHFSLRKADDGWLIDLVDAR